MRKVQTTTVQTEIPVGLFNQAQQLVKTGWVRSLDDIIVDALRRYLEAHRAELMEEFIRQDIEWGLYGDEFL